MDLPSCPARNSWVVIAAGVAGPGRVEPAAIGPRPLEDFVVYDSESVLAELEKKEDPGGGRL